MIVSKKHKKLILADRHPERITTVIPTAKIFEWKGKKLVALPHRIDEVRVLRNMGLNAPSPVEHHYEWSGQYKPFAHQAVTSGFLTLNPRGFILSEMGTGKTLSLLWAVDYLKQQGQLNSLLIVSPLSTLERVWGDEVFKHFPHLNFVVLHGSAERRRKLLKQPADIYIINHDGLKVLEDELIARKDIDAVAIDEVAVYRSSKSDRYAVSKRVLEGRKYVWGLTGSPTPNAPTDAWAQCRLISPEKVPKYFSRFRDTVMRQITPFKWAPRPEALTVVRDAMQPAVLFTLDECIDLPEQTYLTRRVEQSPTQKKAYTDMLNKLKVESDRGEITAVNEAVKVGKLLQIAVGHAYSQDGSTISFDGADRIRVTKELIEESSAKVLVFVPYTGALEAVAAALREDYEVGIVQGSTSKHERDVVFSNFQNGGPMRVIVANPGTLSHGLTLTAADTIIWFGPINSNETYQQACARVRRPGQKRTTVIVHLTGTPLEDKAYARLKNKQSMQGLLLDEIKKEAVSNGY